MKRINVKEEVLKQPTFLSETALAEFTSKAISADSQDEQDDTDEEDPEEEYKTIDDYYMIYGNICVVMLNGVLMKNKVPDDTSLDYTDIAMISDILSAVKDNPMITCVWLLVDSPGGFVTGISSLADQVYELDAVKPVYCYVDGQDCSAAYWITSQARAIYTSEDSTIGSIGAFKTILNRTKQLEQMGQSLEVYSAGEDKMMENPFIDRTKDQKAFIQSEQVDKPYGQFTNAVNRKRPQVSLKDVKARVWSADSAVGNGLSDGIYNTFSDAVNDKTPISY